MALWLFLLVFAVSGIHKLGLTVHGLISLGASVEDKQERMPSSSLLLLPTPLCSFCPSAGARAPARSPDERDPGGQELLALQNSGLPEELGFLLLQLHVPDPVLSKGGPRLDYPLSISLPPAGCTLGLRNTSWRKKQRRNAVFLFPAGGKAELAGFLDCKHLKRWGKKQAEDWTNHRCFTWCFIWVNWKVSVTFGLWDRWRWIIIEACSWFNIQCMMLTLWC